MMKSLYIVPALLLAGVVSAQADNNSPSDQNGQMPSSNQMSIKQEVMKSLSKAGYTDVSVVPMSFLVHAKDAKGRPVAMMIGPDSMTKVTEVAMPGGDAGQQGQKALTAGQLDAFMQNYGKNGTLTLDQATKAAKSHFQALDKKHDGKVDQNELIPAGVSTQDFDANNPDKDTTLEEGEYVNLVKKKFDAADAKSAGKLTEGELASQPGQALMRLLQ